MTTQPTPEERRRTFVGLQDRFLAHHEVPATSRFVQLADPPMTAHVLDVGTGEPVIVLHGGDGEAVDWAPLLAELQHDAHLYAVDRPGFGLSDPFDYRRVDLRKHAGDFVVSLLDALGLPSATVMGGSMGGFFTLAAALDHPERVERVILVGYPLGLTRDAPIPLRIIGTVPGLARHFMRRAGASLDSQKQQYRTMFHIDPDTLPDLYFETRLAGVRLDGAQQTWATLLRRVAGLRGVHPSVYLGDELAGLTQPTLIIWAEHDMAPVTEGSRAAERIPDATFVCFEDTGHFPFLEAPQRTAEHVRAFFERTRSRERTGDLRSDRGLDRATG